MTIGENMKVKLIEHYQDKKIHLVPGQESEVGAVLGAWLVEHGKAVEVKEPAPKPEPKQDAPKIQNVKKPQRGRGAK